MFLSVIAFAQKPVRFGVYVGGVTPFGNLGEGDEIKKTAEYPLGDIHNWAYINEDGTQGYGDLGFNVGFDVTLNLPAGFGVFGGVDFFYNGTKSMCLDYFEDLSAAEIAINPNIKEISTSMPATMNIPVLFGVNYIHNFNNIVGVWGEAGVGPNFRLISSLVTKTEYLAAITDPINDVTFDKTTETQKYNSAVTFGFKIGAGAILWDKMSIGLDFYSLGSAKVEGSYEFKEGDKEITLLDNKFKGNKAISASELVIRVGYHF